MNSLRYVWGKIWSLFVTCSPKHTIPSILGRLVYFESTCVSTGLCFKIPTDFVSSLLLGSFKFLTLLLTLVSIVGKFRLFGLLEKSGSVVCGLATPWCISCSIYSLKLISVWAGAYVVVFWEVMRLLTRFVWVYFSFSSSRNRVLGWLPWSWRLFFIIVAFGLLIFYLSLDGCLLCYRVESWLGAGLTRRVCIGRGSVLIVSGLAKFSSVLRVFTSLWDCGVYCFVFTFCFV